MTVVAGEGDELTAWVGDGIRGLVLATLEAYSAGTAGDLANAKLDDAERRGLEVRLEQLGHLLQQIEDTSGPVHLSGPTELVVAVVRATASQATYELESLVESIADGGVAPATNDQIASLRTRTTAATSSIEALIACESTRQQA